MIYLIGLCSVNSQYFVEQLDSSASETHKEEFDIFCSEIQNILQNAVSRSIQWTVIMKGCRRGKQCWELAGAIVNTGIDTNGLEHKIGQSLSGINFLWLLHVWCSFIINKRQHLCVFVCLFWVFFSSFFLKGGLGERYRLAILHSKKWQYWATNRGFFSGNSDTFLWSILLCYLGKSFTGTSDQIR